MNLDEKRAELLELYDTLNADRQRIALEILRDLRDKSQLRGESGASILTAVGGFDPAALDEMEDAIRAETEEIDWHGWQ